MKKNFVHLLLEYPVLRKETKSLYGVQVVIWKMTGQYPVLVSLSEQAKSSLRLKNLIQNIPELL